jgi:hypothetical protein
MVEHLTDQVRAHSQSIEQLRNELAAVKSDRADAVMKAKKSATAEHRARNEADAKRTAMAAAGTKLAAQLRDPVLQRNTAASHAAQQQWTAS